jgi:hypothetical protein
VNVFLNVYAEKNRPTMKQDVNHTHPGYRKHEPVPSPELKIPCTFKTLSPPSRSESIAGRPTLPGWVKVTEFHRAPDNLRAELNVFKTESVFQRQKEN